MEKESYYMLFALIVLAICIGAFLIQYTHDTPTYMVVNGTEVAEGGNFSGMLIDAYGQGVPNRTVSFHKPGNQNQVISNAKTDETGQFNITNATFVDGAEDNYYNNFSFAGDERYHSCTYEGNITVISK